MARLLGHRQTKEAATDKPDLRPPRHISTLPDIASQSTGRIRTRSGHLQFFAGNIPLGVGHCNVSNRRGRNARGLDLHLPTQFHDTGRWDSKTGCRVL